MTACVFSPLAKCDIEEIWDYTVAQWNIRQAEIYVREIQAAIERIAAEPGIARSCDHVRAGYRKYPAGSHVIYFRMTPDGIEVVRILHSHMDFERLL